MVPKAHIIQSYHRRQGQGLGNNNISRKWRLEKYSNNFGVTRKERDHRCVVVDLGPCVLAADRKSKALEDANGVAV
ncbi:hypothetical protein U9M48_025662 [Paspalum notatum var. saurae]|uniref:Uncharacterized protein n=1 Tax=Paspalum notatum var. saurae TaxID=547442 RepID=A0AAQ3WXK5_PASNO